MDRDTKQATSQMSKQAAQIVTSNNPTGNELQVNGNKPHGWNP